MATAETTEERTFDFKSPMRKLLEFFRRSRDGWKAKYMAVKQKCKLLGNQVRAVEKSREKWRLEAAEALQRVQQLQRELDQKKRAAAC